MRAIFRRIKDRYSEGTLWDVLLRAGPLQMEPRKQTDNYSQSHLHKGPSYHKTFLQHPGRRIIWELERETLYKIVQEKKLFKKHLDFAGGTGRIAGVLEKHCNEQYVLDISDEMLAVARKNLSKAKIICADFKETPPEVDKAEFDLITAFRFFPNAEPALRESAMRFIASKLCKGGWLICNNHRNFWSFPYFAKRLTFSGGSQGMSNSEMIALAKQCGLVLVRTYSMGILPQTEKKAILPWSVTGKIENTVFKYSGNRHRRGYNVIYVFEKK